MLPNFKHIDKGNRKKTWFLITAWVDDVGQNVAAESVMRIPGTEFRVSVPLSALTGPCACKMIRSLWEVIY